MGTAALETCFLRYVIVNALHNGDRFVDDDDNDYDDDDNNNNNNY